MLPRCIDEWHGQLLCDTARPQQGAGSAQGQGAGAGTGSGAARGGAASVKQEPGLDGAEEHGAGGLAAGAGPGPGLWEMTEAALAAVCWLRQPPGGRFWSTSALAAKRLGAAAAGQQPGQVESFDSIFCGPDAPIPGVRLCAGYRGRLHCYRPRPGEAGFVGRGCHALACGMTGGV